MNDQDRPLVVTLMLDAVNEARLEAERRLYFPAARNQVPAHVSLFHALPRAQEAAVRAELEAATGVCAVFDVQAADVRRYGGGVGYNMESGALRALHARLRAAWLPWLTPQDAQGFRPHVMVQNKAGEAAAQALLARLSAGFRPWAAQAQGVRLWTYEGGPWALAGEFVFSGADGAQ